MFRLDQLDSRCSEAQLRELVARGATYAAIARRIECSPKTARRIVLSRGLRTPPQSESRETGIRTAERAPLRESFAAIGRRGYLEGLAADAERDALAAGDVDPAKADAILSRRYAQVRALRDAQIKALDIGDDDLGEEYEKTIRRDGTFAAAATWTNHAKPDPFAACDDESTN